MKKVVDKFIAELKEQLAVKKIYQSFRYARTWLAKKGHDPASVQDHWVD